MIPGQTTSWVHMPGSIADTSNQWQYQAHIPMVQSNGQFNNNRRPMQAGRTLMQGNHQRNLDPHKHFGSLTTYPQQSNGNKRNKIATTSKTNLYISGLSESDSDETVRALVEGVVEPKSSKAMMSSGKCRGSGFIDCVSEEDAEKAKKHILDNAKTKGLRLSVKYAFENEKDMLNVYVRNLPRVNFTKEKLEQLFNGYGHVTSVKLLEGSSGGYTGTGFVRFSTSEDAQEAVERVNKQQLVVDTLDSEAKPVVCKLADKTDPRRKQRSSPLEDPSNGGVGNQIAILSPVGNGYMPHPMGAGAGPQSALMQHPIPIASLLSGMSLNGSSSGPQQMQFQTAVSAQANISPHGNGITMTTAPTAAAYQPGGAPSPYFQAQLQQAALYHQPQAGYAMYPPAGHLAYAAAAAGYPGFAQAGQNHHQQQQLNADAAQFIPQHGGSYHG